RATTLVAPFRKNDAYFAMNPAVPARTSTPTISALYFTGLLRRSKATTPRTSASNHPPFDPDQNKHASAAAPMIPMRSKRAPSVNRRVFHNRAAVGGKSSNKPPAKAFG